MDYEPQMPPHLCCVCCGKREGYTHTLWRCSAGARLWPFVCNIGPDWPCNACTWLLVLAPVVGITVAAWDQVHVGFLIGLGIAAIVNLVILALADFSDPYLLKQTREEMMAEQARLEEAGADLSQLAPCRKCNVLRKAGTVHCYTCDRCVIALDHHCPWHGKCIGGANILPFYAFLWSVCGLIVLFVIVVFIWFTGGRSVT